MITINIEITPHNKIKDLFRNIHNKCEDILFSIIEKLPEKLIPNFLMIRMEKHLNKRIAELHQQSIQANWKNVYLHKAIDDIHQKEKAPSEE